MVTITCYYHNHQFDLDNILKPILDAMNKLVYDDDGQITDLHCHKRELSLVLNVPNPSAVLSSVHARAMPFVHIIVDYAPDQEVIF